MAPHALGQYRTSRRKLIGHVTRPAVVKGVEREDQQLVAPYASSVPVIALIPPYASSVPDIAYRARRQI
eukprot:2389642-Rhodomonas_salina.2